MRFLFPLLALGALAACNGLASPGQTDPESRVVSGEDGAERGFALADFDEVELRGPDNVEVTLGEEFSIRAVGDEAALEDLEVTVRGNTLRIGRESDGWFDGDSEGRATIYVTLPRLTEVAVAGSGNMTVDRAEADEFEASIAGSGDLSIASLTARDTELSIAGSGTITIAGTAQDLEIDIAGSGNVEAADLRVATLEANIAGSGDVRGYATEAAEASLLGSGDVEVRGGARCRSNALGSGELRCV